MNKYRCVVIMLIYEWLYCNDMNINRYGYSNNDKYNKKKYYNEINKI